MPVNQRNGKHSTKNRGSGSSSCVVDVDHKVSYFLDSRRDTPQQLHGMSLDNKNYALGMS